MNTTIAIIASDHSCQQSMRSILTDASYAVLEYGAGGVLESHLSGVEVMCIGVTDDSGLQTIERLAAVNPDLPIIAVGRAEIASRVVNAGAYDFVAMPLDPTLFRTSVGHAVEKRQLTEKVRSLSSQLANSQESQESDEVVPLRELERRAIARALRATKGSVTKAAKLLGIGRATLYRRLANPEMAALRPRRGYATAPTSHLPPSVAA